jgi:hypothetical protein
MHAQSNRRCSGSSLPIGGLDKVCAIVDSYLLGLRAAE